MPFNGHDDRWSFLQGLLPIAATVDEAPPDLRTPTVLVESASKGEHVMS